MRTTAQIAFPLPSAIDDGAPGPFQAGVALVNAALVALRDVPNAVEAMTMMAAIDGAGLELAQALDALEGFIVRTGSVGSRNLLVRGARAGTEPFLVFGLARRTSGAVHVQPIEIDLGPIALLAPPTGALDQLRDAVGALRAGTDGRAPVRACLASPRCPPA